MNELVIFIPALMATLATAASTIFAVRNKKKSHRNEEQLLRLIKEFENESKTEEAALRYINEIYDILGDVDDAAVQLGNHVIISHFSDNKEKNILNFELDDEELKRFEEFSLVENSPSKMVKFLMRMEASALNANSKIKIVGNGGAVSHNQKEART